MKSHLISQLSQLVSGNFAGAEELLPLPESQETTSRTEDCLQKCPSGDGLGGLVLVKWKFHEVFADGKYVLKKKQILNVCVFFL